MNEWCVKQHGASGLTQACRESKVSCAEAERLVLDMVARHTSSGQCPLAGEWRVVTSYHDVTLRRVRKHCEPGQAVH